VEGAPDAPDGGKRASRGTVTVDECRDDRPNRPSEATERLVLAEAELDVPPVCADCRRESRDDENAEDEWRVESDGVGDLLVFCAECWRREFGSS
jgi:hypothetical protein